jgi:hypothetical protein
MSSFRQRPLTWLFIIATACLDLVAIAHLVNHEADWFGAIAVGQLCLVGALLPVGRAHRLLRAILFLSVPILLSVPDYRTTDLTTEAGEIIQIEGVAPYVLGISFVITALVSFFSFAFMALNALCVRRSGGAMASFRFPIIEFFGWTIVIAVSTLVMRIAKLEWFDFVLLAAVAECTLFPAALVVFAYSLLKTWFLKAALVVSAAVSLYALAVKSENLEWVVMVGAYAYVAGWLLVKRMDDAMSHRREAPAALSEPSASPASPFADDE